MLTEKMLPFSLFSLTALNITRLSCSLPCHLFFYPYPWLIRACILTYRLYKYILLSLSKRNVYFMWFLSQHHWQYIINFASLTVYHKFASLTVYLNFASLTVYLKVASLTVYLKVESLTVYLKVASLTVYLKVTSLTEHLKTVKALQVYLNQPA